MLSPAELEQFMPALAEILSDTVNGGASLGFLPPLAREEALQYWWSLRPALQAGSRLLLLACAEDRVVGSGQLAIPSPPSGRHRAVLQKLFVASAWRGLGVGRSLMAALHDTARAHGRSLVILNTRRGGSAEGFYRGLGYREVGVLPGWTVGPAGERYDHVAFCRELSP